MDLEASDDAGKARRTGGGNGAPVRTARRLSTEDSAGWPSTAAHTSTSLACLAQKKQRGGEPGRNTCRISPPGSELTHVKFSRLMLCEGTQ
eukprot:6335712-Pyramimonas_sp.AAC.1